MKSLAVFILYLLIVPLVNSHASSNLPRSGQTATYADNDDGESKTGRPWPTIRFSADNDGTVTDNLTGLVWSKDADLMRSRDALLDTDDLNGDGAVTWIHALDYIKKLNSENYLGYNDWRLPTLNELVSLVNQGEPDSSAWLNELSFFNAVPYPYWSSTSGAGNAGTAWTVSMQGGHVNTAGKTGTRHVWPVRGKQSDASVTAPPKTGQRDCHDSKGRKISCSETGQDGELRIGASWPDPRFTDNGDQTITDNLSGITWTKDANTLTLRTPPDVPNTDGAVSWQDALNLSKILNRETYLGFTDWRLPNRNEMASIINYAVAEPSSWFSGIGFLNVRKHYWSSGTTAINTGKAWKIGVDGTILDEEKTADAGSFVWPIRDGQTASLTVDKSGSGSGGIFADTGTIIWSGLTGRARYTPGVKVTLTALSDSGSTFAGWSGACGGIDACSVTMDADKRVMATFDVADTSNCKDDSADTLNASEVLAKSSSKAVKAAATLNITTTTLVDGYVGASYSQSLAATGGRTPYTWAKASGNLPAGLSLKSTGVIKGTPTAAGSSTFVVKVKDARKKTATKSLSITVKPSLKVSTTSLPSGIVGTAYSQSLAATGGKMPYTWSITDGSLPDGLTLDAATGAIVGTPTVQGDSSFTVRAMDVNNTTATGSLFLSVNPGLKINTTQIPDSFVGIPYSQALSASGGKTPYTWSITEGSLPAGLLLDAGAGAISGTPNVTGSSSFTVQVKDGMSVTTSKTFSMTIVDFGSISGIVSDRETGAPLPGANVTLVLSGIRSTGLSHLIYSCNTTPLTTSDYDLVSANDDAKLSCISGGATNSMYFKVHNPYGTDAFSFRWNGMGTKYNEYLAQSFSPTTGGNLTKVSFYPTSLSSGSYYGALTGEIHVQLKTKVGGDIGTQLAESNSIRVDSSAFSTGTWIDFTFSSPVPIVAGQEYYLEIQGHLEGGHNLWQDGFSTIFWANGATYSNGSAYERSAGLWSKLDNPLAFRTYVNDQLDTEIAPSTSNLSTSMGGSFGAYPLIYMQLYNPASGSWEAVGQTDNNLYGASQGFVANIADLSVYWSTGAGFDRYYDQNGWLTVKVTNGQIPYWSNTPYTSLITDQFSMTFTRTLVTVTDANGAYSFTSLPEGSYNLSFEKPAYGAESADGALSAGQALTISQIIGKAQPASLQGTVSYYGGPLPGITVTITDPVGAKSVVTDSQGSYLISGIVYGNYTVTFEGPQVQTKTLTGTLAPGQVGVLNTTLVPSSITLTLASPSEGDVVSTNPLTVTGNALNASTVTVTAYTYTTGASVEYSAGIVNGAFSASIPLETGFTRLTATAKNNLSQSAEKSVTVSLAPFTLRNLGDTGNVTVMEVTGNYDAKNADGSINDLPRKAIATEYFKSHGDQDFLVLLSTFDYALSETDAQGFYLEVKNDIQGINRPIFDNSSQFGSTGRLQGTIDMGNVTSLAASPYGPKLDTTLTTLNHELMHRFGAYVRFMNPDNTLNPGLLGRDSAHWSWLLDSKGSIMYGNGWKDNGDGTFTSTAAQSGFSPLDLYLMGMIPKEQVPPMLLIENPAIDKTQLPQLGATVTGTVKTVTIDDIIAAEGARIPDSAGSQKKFKLGYVLLTRQGNDPAAAVQAIEALRTAFAGRFAELTGGAGGVEDIPPSLNVFIEAPVNGATVTGPDVTVSGVVINSGGAETGVTVNGIPATVTGSRFIVNHAPLQAGANSISVYATDSNGLTAVATVSVTASPGNYIRLNASTVSGTAPLTVSLQLDGTFNITNPQINYTGPAPADLQAGTVPNEYILKFSAEGIYTVTASAIDPDGQTCTDTVTITVLSKTKLDALLRGKWEGMRTALAAADVAAAVSNFSKYSKDSYLQQFTDISSSLPQVAAGMANITMVKVEGNVAEYDLRDVIDGVTYSFYLLFVKDLDGLWKIWNF